ncbi:MAG: sulfotransferase [Akkermansiaceae bacterium]|nr:sulfotransferase [Akkermansiaceae bacterium]NNM29292.1 sulfotransferase [Akkermansiaceae bacterium]
MAVMVVFLPVLAGSQLVHWLGFLLDEIFFRGYRQVAVREPVFVTGVPRSGTTFLHRVLARDEERFSTFSTGELLFGLSVTERKFWGLLGAIDRHTGGFGRRAVAWMTRKAGSGLEGVHQVGLDAPEEDYLALVPVMSCFILVLAFPFSERLWRLAFFDERMDAADRRWVLRFYRRCLQKHIHAGGGGRQLLSKNAAFGSWASSLRDEFPDCRLVLCVRDPAEAVPSQLSSLEGGMALFDVDRERRFFRERMVEVLEHSYAHLAEVADEAPADEVVVVRMEEMQDGLVECVEGIYERFGFRLGADFRRRLEEEAATARRYRSRHDYSLEQFGLSGKAIRARFSQAYLRFAFSAPANDGAATLTT